MSDPELPRARWRACSRRSRPCRRPAGAAERVLARVRRTVGGPAGGAAAARSAASSVSAGAPG
ncbi:MAG: hypothetical protein U1F43_23575 [Myxococcota bacterium]